MPFVRDCSHLLNPLRDFDLTDGAGRCSVPEDEVLLLKAVLTHRDGKTQVQTIHTVIARERACAAGWHPFFDGHARMPFVSGPITCAESDHATRFLEWLFDRPENASPFGDATPSLRAGNA